MAVDVQPAELLAAIEEALVNHQAFGDSTYIIGQLDVVFRRRLERVSEQLPAARRLLAAFGGADDDTRYRVAGNTVIRCALQHAHGQIESNARYGLPVEECEKIFEATARHLEQGQSGTPFENGPTRLDRLGDEPHHGWIWSEEYPDDLFGRSFRRIVDMEYGGDLVTIGDDELAMLRRGEQLLRELLPSLARSALGHAHQIACFPDAGFWKGKVSSSQIRMGGTIFLSRQMLMNPWCTAEHLLHESLHQKLYDFRHGHSLLEPGASGPDSPRVCSLWNAQELNQANHWDTHRAFAAFHVYVQLALLALVAEQRAEELEAAYGPYRGLVESRKALDRARYLGEKLGEACSHQLGEAGKRLLSWLMSILDYLDPAPPPKGAYVHLLLDLYQREANRVEAVFREGEAASAGLARELAPVVAAEVESTRHLLSATAGDQALERFDETVGQYAEEDLGPKFPTVRRLIARTLLEASADGYGLKARAADGPDPDELVRQMVEAGSERLYLIQTNVPPAVAGAKRRARDFRFTKSCEDKVGRLLAVLAAAVPPGGRILEIGTGVGVGLGWIVTGLRARTDVEVLSIEGDLRLSNAARIWDWPGYVEILTADALEALPNLGEFNLVFADAAPVKYGDVGPALRALRPGGLLVVDDLCATHTATEQQQADRDALRHALLRHPDLQAVELEWATQIILATRTGAPAGPAPSRAKKARASAAA